LLKTPFYDFVDKYLYFKGQQHSTHLA